MKPIYEQWSKCRILLNYTMSISSEKRLQAFSPRKDQSALYILTLSVWWMYYTCIKVQSVDNLMPRPSGPLYHTPPPGQADLEALPEVLSNKDDLSNEFQFTTDVAALSRKSVEGEFQVCLELWSLTVLRLYHFRNRNCPVQRISEYSKKFWTRLLYYTYNSYREK